MSINTDNMRRVERNPANQRDVDISAIKAGDWVQVANGDWHRVDKATGFKHRPLIVINNTWRALGDIADLLTAHLTAEEVEANGLPVSDREIVEYVAEFGLPESYCPEPIAYPAYEMWKVGDEEFEDFRQAIDKAREESK